MVLAASTLITPDIPMMFFWSLLLYSAYTYLDEDNKKYALLTGFAAGGLLLSKYTGILPIFTLAPLLSYSEGLFSKHEILNQIISGKMRIAIRCVRVNISIIK